MKVVTAEEMASLEKEAVSKGITVASMMEKAGHAVARVILALKPTPKTALVLAGPGNNGGDGLVAAYYLLKAGVKVTAYLWKRQTESDPLVDRLVKNEATLVLAHDDEGLKNLQSLLKETEIVVDALLGTGFRPPIKRDLKLILRTLAQEREKRFDPPAKVSIRSVRALPSTVKPRPFIVAVDIPTGVNGTTGEADPAAVPADITVTFGFPKRGHFLFPGAELTGELLIADIGIPQELASEIRVELVTPELVQKWLPPRPKGSHKGTFWQSSGNSRLHQLHRSSLLGRPGGHEGRSRARNYGHTQLHPPHSCFQAYRNHLLAPSKRHGCHSVRCSGSSFRKLALLPGNPVRPWPWKG